MVELTTALLFVSVFLKFPVLSDPKLWFYLFFVSSLLVIFFIDLKKGIIPDRIVFPTLAVSSIFVLLGNNPTNHVLSGLGAFIFFFFLNIITRGRGMGGGDIKFALVLGSVLGFPKIIVSLYLAFLTGAVASLILILWHKKQFRKDIIAFGPFLVIGTLITIFLGDPLVSLLLNFW